jgi:4-hydroxybenzoate polyprenyltransferase
MLKKIVNLIKIFRIFDWNRTILVLTICGLFLLFLENKLNPEYILTFILYIFYLIISASYGFLINSYADRKDDFKANKKVYIFFFPKKFIQILLMIFAFIMIIFPIVFKNFIIFLIGILIFFLANFYSLKPIRLKERGFLGFLLLTIVMMPLPYIFFLLLFKINLINFLSFFIFIMLYSFTDEISHQIEDYYNDKKTNTKTWIIKYGLRRAHIFFKYITILLGLYPFIFLFIFHPINAILIILILQLILIDLYHDYFLLLEK